MTLKVSIAMATYNGGDYLAAQLESLTKQEFLPCELVVCDDQSNDNTVAILESFSKSAPFPVLITRNEKNIGAIENFFKAAKKCSGEWICFCDQDDVWLPNKISSAVDEISRHPNINLVLQSAYLVDKNLISSGVVFPACEKYGYFENNQLGLLFEWHGFLQTVRADIFHMCDYNMRPLNRYRSFNKQSHDQWTCMIANAIGGVSILSEVSALYRRHPQTVTGDYDNTKESFVDMFKRRPALEELYWEAKICTEYASYLSSQVDSVICVEHVVGIEKAIKDYTARANILRARSELYESGDAYSRLCKLFKLGQLRAYSGRSRITIGVKGFLRDAILQLYHP
ncbi:glycosyltransferase [Candidatus Electrothrix sp.]|uniref:glycosyltransferase n=1 Tax=Candidatus Electrothrix sp. TaxID=2170559 RepID=UPI0040564276